MGSPQETSRLAHTREGLKRAAKKAFSVEGVGAGITGAGVVMFVASGVDVNMSELVHLPAAMAEREAAGIIPPRHPDYVRAIRETTSNEAHSVIPQYQRAVADGKGEVTIQIPDIVKANHPRWYEIRRDQGRRDEEEQKIRKQLGSADVGFGLTRNQRIGGLISVGFVTILAGLSTLIASGSRRTTTSRKTKLVISGETGTKIIPKS